MGKYKKMFGKIGEDYAASYLDRNGYKILERNVFIGGGEIDIIARKGKLIVFVEVKTRQSDKYVDICDLIDSRKEESLIASCEEYLTKNCMEAADFRIDLIGIISKEGIVKKFEHIKGVV